MAKKKQHIKQFRDWLYEDVVKEFDLKYDSGNKQTEGLVEFMLAKGLQTPQKPYFFLQEYKPEKRRDNGPALTAIDCYDCITTN